LTQRPPDPWLRPADLEDSIKLINAGFWAARALSSAVEVGLFSKMGDLAWEPAEIANVCDLAPRGAEVLLRFLVAFGFAQNEESRFRLTPHARELWDLDPSPLTTEAPVASDVWTAMGRLTESVRHGSSTDEFFNSHDQSQTAGFARTMEVQARRVAEPLLDALDLAGRRCLLDLGGGTGHLARSIAQRWPSLQVVLLDRPGVLEHARDRGLGRTVTLVAGDFWTTEPAVGHDVLLLSKVLHDWSDEQSSLLLERWIEPMPRASLVIVCEEMLTPHDAGVRQWPALLDVFLFAVLGDARVRSPEEVTGLLRRSGCGVIQQAFLPDGSTLLLSIKA
jgi:hypothetical protein